MSITNEQIQAEIESAELTAANHGPAHSRLRTLGTASAARELEEVLRKYHPTLSHYSMAKIVLETLSLWLEWQNNPESLT